MLTETATFELPPVLKMEECQQLHTFLTESAGLPVTLNGAAVTRIGGLSAQLMRMAADVWTAQSVPFTLADPSQALRDSLGALGLNSILADTGGVQ